MNYFHNQTFRLMRTMLCITLAIFGISTSSAQSNTKTLVVDPLNNSVTVGINGTPLTYDTTWEFIPAANNTPATLRLNGFRWETEAKTALLVTSDSLIIELADGSTNTFKSVYNGEDTVSGIDVSNISKLIINAPGMATGILNIEGGTSSIGGSYGIQGGTTCSIIINNGTINSAGGDLSPASQTNTIYSHGINANNITINGGIITTTGGLDGTSIGMKAQKEINIIAGKVTAKSKMARTTIGIHAIEDINISGGIVEVETGSATNYLSSGIYSKRNINISGGKINAKSGGAEAFSYAIMAGATKKINITGGEITAESLTRAFSIVPESLSSIDYFYQTSATGDILLKDGNNPGPDFNETYLKIICPYKITAPQPEVNVASYALADSIVHFTISPLSGYKFVSVTVTDKNNSICFESKELDSFSFTMPESDVIITATFEKIITYGIRIDYTDDDLTVRIVNTGNIATGDLNLVLSGQNEDAFSLTSNKINSIAIDNNAELTLTPATDLEPGTYLVRLIASGSNALYDYIDITYTVEAPVATDNIKGRSPLKAYIQDGVLKITGLTVGKAWQVYTATGQLVKTAIADNNEATVFLPDRGVYILSSGNETVKIIR